VAVKLDAHVPASVLAVFAHPDDPEASCGGTLAAWARAGARVEVAIVNRGDKGSADPATDPDELATRRAGEVAEAAAVLGVRAVHLLGRPDGESENDLALRAELVALVRAVRPEVIICPDPTARFFGDSYVNHRDHRVCGDAVLDAVAPAAASPLYFPQAGPPHQVPLVYLAGSLEPDTAVGITAVLDAKVAALACHRTQLAEAGAYVGELVAARAAEAARGVGVKHAETFRVLRLA
jgi:LmbE family N-acetylglucosaminyl deacetylase